ncbi:MAG: hypothetical protein K2N32_00270 [Clostridia bacterium]|nr:hypothetical protein [Clostridia bacterium]
MEDYLQFQFDADKELGTLLFEYDDTKNLYNSSMKIKRAKKSPWTYYFSAVLLFLFGWIIYSVVVLSIENSIKLALILSVSNLFVFAFLTFLTITIIFGAWGRIMRFAMRNPEFLHKVGAEKSRQQDAINAMLNAETKKPHRNALSVYENYIEIVNDGKTTLYKKEHVQKLVVVKDRKKFTVRMISNTHKSVEAKVFIPVEYLGNFVRVCSDISTRYENSLGYDTSISLDRSVGSLIGLTLFVLIPVALGSALIWAHYCVDEVFPAFLGIFFIMGGILLICGLYSFIPFVKHVMVPMLFGVLFTIGPLLLSLQLFNAIGIVLNARNYFTFLNPITLGFTYIMAIGLVVVLSSVRSMVDYFIFIRKKSG